MIGIITFPLILIGFLILIVRAFYFENKLETFDLTAPTIFDNGLMIFHSQKEHSAAFFSFNLSFHKLEKRIAQRALTVLFKILPASTILSLEWSTQNECFINFFIKLEKTSFLTQARALLENITNSFNKMIGEQDTCALKGEEIELHFFMGILGRIRQIKAKGKGLDIYTDITREKRFITYISPLNIDTLKHLLKNPNHPNFTRVFFAIKKVDNALKTAGYLTMVSDIENIPSNLFPPTAMISIINMPAHKSIRKFGDVVTRNLIFSKTETSNYEDTVNKILEFISAAKRTQEDMKRPAMTLETSSQILDSKTWRENLIQLATHLNLPFETNAQIFVEGIPIRFDGKIRNLLFFITSATKTSHLKWLVKNFTKFLKEDNQMKIILLLRKALQKPLVEALLSQSVIADSIQEITTKEELKAMLNDYKKLLSKETDVLAQVA